MSGRADTLIVGGGVVGLALGYELLARAPTRRVVVVDRGMPGHGATWAAGGMLAPISEAETESADTLRLGLDSLARYPGFVGAIERLTRLDTGFDLRGTLWAAIGRDDRAELDRQAQALADAGHRIEPLSAAATLALEPRLSGRVVSGLRLPDEGQIDPRRLSAALLGAIEALGGLVLPNVEVTSIQAERSGRFVVRARDRDSIEQAFEATQVALAAGAWSFRGITLPLADPGLRPVKGQLVRLRGPRLVSHVVRTPRAYLIPRADGELLVGATVEEVGFDERSTAGAVMELLRAAWEALPALEDLALVETSVGFRSAVDDHRPRIGPTEIEGLFLAVGHYRNGVLLAPATAAYLAQAMLEGGVPLALAPFLPRPSASVAGELRA